MHHFRHLHLSFLIAPVLLSLVLPTVSVAASRPMTPLQVAILKDKDIYSPTCDIRGKPTQNIQNLLSKGADVNERDAEGNIALVQALRLNDVSQTLLLLEKGADSKLLNNAGESPLLKGLSGDYQNGAHNTQDVLNIVLSAQGLPSDSNQFFKEAVQKNLTLLLSHNIKVPDGYSEENLWKDLNWVNPPSSTWRVIRQNFRAYQAGARFLPPRLRSPALIAPQEDSKLIKAIKAGELKAVEELLKKGESPDQISAYFHDGGDVKLPPPEDTGLYANPALGVALHLKRFDIVHALLESGANPNLRGQFYLTSPDGKRSYPMYGVPLLYVAVGMGDENLVKDFASHHADLGNGANVNAVNSKGETPLEKAAQSGFVDMAATLILNKADPAPISAKFPDFYKSVQDRLDAGKVLSSQISEAIKKSPSISSKEYLNEPVYREYQSQLAAYNAAVELEKSEKEEKEKPFDETKWQELVAEQSSSPCLKDRTAKCLMRQVAKMKSAQGKLNLGDSAGYSESARADGNFVEAVINYGDQETARELLKLIPDSAKAQRMSLRFMTKEYEPAMKILNELQETQKAGTDYGAIWALTQVGDLDKAFELAKTVITWQYTDLNPPPAGHTRMTSSGFCVGNITSAYPRSIGVLANKLADLKQYEKAHEVAKMLRQYIANKLNGRGYFNCNWKSAKWAYEDAIFGLAEAFAKNGERKRAKSIYDEIQSSAKEMDTNALLIAGEMKHNGFEKEVSSVSSSVENVKLRDPNPDDMFFDQRVRQESDPGAIALGTGGEYEQAIKRLEGLSYPNIRVNTFIDLAQSASKDKKTAELKEILDHLSPYLGKRDRPIDNALDYLDYASLRFEVGDKEASRASLKTALKIYEALKNRQMYERLELGGKVTLLFAKLGDYSSMADFMKDNAIDYNSGAGTTLTNILSYFASNDLWDEFDKFLSEKGDLFKQKGGGEFKDKFSLRGSLGGILISKKQFERYLKVSDAMEAPDQQYYKFKSLVIAGFKKDSGVPDDLFEDMWKRNLEGCKTRKEPTAEKKMVGCYMELLGAIQDSGMFSRTRGDVYMRSGY